MIKNFLIIVTLLASGILSAKQWVEVYSESPVESSFSYESEGLASTRITFKLSGYFTDNSKEGLKVTSPGGVSLLEKGAPDLPIFSTSIQVPDLAEMELEIIESEFVELNINDITPSKGNVTRDVNISSLPFEKGYRYRQNSLYPAEISFLRRPHIIRSVRGQAVVFQPFQYNPVLGVLRIYTDIVLAIKQNGLSVDNPLTRYPSKKRGVKEMENIYKNHFPNYMPINDRYTPLDENGSMLIICHAPFIEAMQPFIDWKVKKGIETTLIDVSTLGDADDIKAFVEEYYYNHGINFLLLVGDIDQIPSCLLYTSPSPRDATLSRMPSSA